MKITEVVRKMIYSEGVNPLPTKVITILFVLMVSILVLLVIT